MARTEEQKAYDRAYYLKHRQAKIAARKAKYQANRDMELARGAEWRSRPEVQTRQKQHMRARRKKGMQLLDEIRLHYGCQNPSCPSRSFGYVPAELDFHHLDPGTKEATVISLVKSQRSKIVAEVNKCIVFCSNCHRRLHAGLVEVDPARRCQVDADLRVIVGNG